MPDPLHQWRCAQHPEITGSCFCDQPEGPHSCDGCKNADAEVQSLPDAAMLTERANE